MSNQIAKKYVNALMKSCTDKELNSFFVSLKDLSLAYKNEKFLNIIESPDVSNIKKEDFILSLSQNKDKKFVNFLKLLSVNDRFNLIPAVSEELKYQVAVKNNEFSGVIMSDFDISDEKIKTLEDNFSKKFNLNVKLNRSQDKYPGVKVEIDDLGLEVSFSLERLKAQMSEHILKAI